MRLAHIFFFECSVLFWKRPEVLVVPTDGVDLESMGGGRGGRTLPRSTPVAQNLMRQGQCLCAVSIFTILLDPREYVTSSSLTPGGKEISFLMFL